MQCWCMWPCMKRKWSYACGLLPNVYIRRAQNSDISTDLVFRMRMDVATWMLMLHSVCLKKPFGYGQFGK